MSDWWTAHPEKKRAKQRRQRVQHLERTRQRERACYWQNVEKRRAAARAYAKAHRKEANERQRRYAAAHPEVNARKMERRKMVRPFAMREANARRRAKKKGADGSHSDAEWLSLLWATAWRCTYCGEPLDETTATRDHRVPLSRGGSDFIENIAVSCAPCNKRKHTKTDAEFTARRA